MRFQALSNCHQATLCNNRVKTKIETCNAGTLHKLGKLENLLKEQKRLKVNIFGISEMRWTGAGTVKKDDYTMIYSGGTKHMYGGGISIDKTTAKSIAEFQVLPACVVLVKFHESSLDLAIIQA